jgi:hypothetical protein
MDLKLHRPHGCCQRSRRPFVSGEMFYSALVRSPAGLERIDCAAECWDGPPERTLAWWRSSYPEPQGGGPELAPVDVLLDVVERLDGQPDEAALRYLLALELVRRRVLRVVEEKRDAEAGDTAGSTATLHQLHLACRRRDTTYTVAVAPPAPAGAGAVQERLTSLLWSGGAA